jgi:molybdopterin synthase sulfur carrier subunit
MTIRVFAMVKEYFDKEFELSGNIGDTEALKNQLVKLNPAAAELLSICRFAVNDEFVDNLSQLSEHDTICILPPGSGG